jgi:hypothetical protein
MTDEDQNEVERIRLGLLINESTAGGAGDLDADQSYQLAGKLMAGEWRLVRPIETDVVITESVNGVPEGVDEAPEAGIPPEEPEGLDEDEHLRNANQALGGER